MFCFTFFRPTKREIKRSFALRLVVCCFLYLKLILKKLKLANYGCSGQGDTMVSILIEFHGFWAYENREAMAADTGDESSHV